MASRTQSVKAFGQSFWLDNIHRRELHDGTIKRLIDEDGISGITSNPTIFMKAVSSGSDYDEQIRILSQAGKDARAIYYRITLDDIREAGNLLKPVFEQTNGEDGFVSIELNPQHAFDTEKSIAEAQQISARDRPAQHHGQGSRHPSGSGCGAPAHCRRAQCKYYAAVFT